MYTRGFILKKSICKFALFRPALFRPALFRPALFRPDPSCNILAYLLVKRSTESNGCSVITTPLTFIRL